MKKIFPLLLSSNLFYTASAGVYVDLDIGQVTRINDGIPFLIMSRGDLTIKLPEESAASPEGTENMEAGEKLEFQLSNKNFQQFLILFDNGVENGWANKRLDRDLPPRSAISTLPVIQSSISRKYLNGTSNRYLSMVFTEDEFIPGRDAYYVQGTPAERQCVSSGGGYSCIPGNSICYPMPVKTTCKDVGGSPGYWVAATQDRTVTHRRQLTIDCDDQTYDIKDDGIGWKSYWQNSTVSRLAQETCPAISSYPLR